MRRGIAPARPLRALVRGEEIGPRSARVDALLLTVGRERSPVGRARSMRFVAQSPGSDAIDVTRRSARRRTGRERSTPWSAPARTRRGSQV